MWNKAENELREVMNELGIEYNEEIWGKLLSMVLN